MLLRRRAGCEYHRRGSSHRKGLAKMASVQIEPSTEIADPAVSPVTTRFVPHPLIVQAYDAYQRELSELLRTHPGQWVAYRGQERLGIAGSQIDLYRRCLENFPLEEILVECVEPNIEPMTMGCISFAEDGTNVIVS
jgi:hypothetical protein